MKTDLQHFFFGKGQMRDPRNANLINSSIALREELSFRKFDKKAQFRFTKVKLPETALLYHVQRVKALFNVANDIF